MLTAAALALAIGGAVPAAVLLGIAGGLYVARSPDRLLDAAYAATFCGLGYVIGG